MADSVRVAVRVRPYIHDYEKVEGIRNVIRMDRATQQTFITNPETNEEKGFTFDFSYNSFVDSSDENHASQETVWNDLGEDTLTNAWEGFNVSLFAYGQSGSGKSHSMVGYPGAEGIVPRACREIFERINRNEDETTTFKVEASMIEIYNEKIRDLFNPTSKEVMKIRENPKTGPYVQSLRKLAVSSYDAISNAMEAGTRARTVAATNLNITSSRAHTIFQIILTQTKLNKETNSAMDKVSTISLIDLAGSERSDRTGAEGDRFKEGCAINLSLSVLGNVIFSLAEKATNSRKSNMVIPYRDSVLTHLLKNSLGGNAKTVMIAAISPADVNFNETLSTLRYADRAKQIKNSAKVNEDPNTTLIRGLKEEIEELRKLLSASSGGNAADRQRLKEDMQENERLLRESEVSWEDRLKAAESMRIKHIVPTTPHLLNLNQDMQLSGVLSYELIDGVNRVGMQNASTTQQIQLSGLNIQKEHCEITRERGERINIRACGPNAKVYVNGKQCSFPDEISLRHGDRIIFGNNHVFLLIVPSQDSKDFKRFSWEMAMNEMNESMINDLTTKERHARLAAEEEAKAMQEKIRELERKVNEEREKAERDARVASDAEKERLMRKQEELENTLKLEIEKSSAQRAAQQKTQKRRAMLEEMIMQTLPMVAEANAIAEELERSAIFSLELVAQVADSKGEALLSSNEIDLESTVCIKVEPMLWVWDRQKFVNRLYLMREMYEDFSENHRDMAIVNSLYDADRDPFLDPDAKTEIGRAYVMLTPLVYMIDIEDAVPIVHYQGKTEGILDLHIALDDDQMAQFENLDTDSEDVTLKTVIGETLKLCIQVRGAKGIPKPLCHNVSVSYRFYHKDVETEPCARSSINPRLNHVNNLSIPVTEDFVDYLTRYPLEFHVWGQSNVEPISAHPSVMVSVYEEREIETPEPDKEEKSQCETAPPVVVVVTSTPMEDESLPPMHDENVAAAEEKARDAMEAKEDEVLKEMPTDADDEHEEYQGMLDDPPVVETKSEEHMRDDHIVEELQRELDQTRSVLEEKEEYIKSIEAEKRILEKKLEQMALQEQQFRQQQQKQQSTSATGANGSQTSSPVAVAPSATDDAKANGGSSACVIS